MHVAVLFEFPTLNGGERSLLAVIAELRRQGVAAEFTALAPQAGPLAEALKEQGVRHVPWSVRDENGQRRPAGAWEAPLVRILNDIQPDVVHANSLAMGRLLGRIADRITRPTTAHLRDIIGLSAAAIDELNRMDRVIAVSDATRRFHAEQGLDVSRTVVVHNGVDLEEFAPRPATGYLHHELGLPRNTRFMATIGQIGLRKGWDVLAAALPVIGAGGWPGLDDQREEAPVIAQEDRGFAQSGSSPGHPVAQTFLSVRPDRNVRATPAHWLIIGERHSEKEESRRYEAELRERIRSVGWEGRAHWLGTRSDISRLLNEIDLLAHPAKQEPLGRVLLEAMAAGVPIVATDVGGTREILEPEISGRLVPANDPQRLAAAISGVLSDGQLADRFRHESRRRAVSLFDIRQAARNLWQAWEEVVAR